LTGDNLLISVAETIKKNVRSTDIVARLGGDEFVIFLPETGEEQSKIVIDKLQKYLNSLVGENEWPVTFSIGVITCNKPIHTVHEMIKMADTVMYSVKRAGKNAVKYKLCKKTV